ncbi:MAG: hypothetical protein K2M89_01790 [Clostridiales bacterium]|nr:hypothetical protein [Clostridiales bacterium]
MLRIQSLGDALKHFNQEKLQDILKEFKCAKDDDIERFLSVYAIEYERKGVCRTFLVMDTNYRQKILGYFAIGLNVMHFKKTLKVADAYEGINLYEKGYRPIYKLFMIGKNDDFSECVKMADIFKTDVLQYIRTSQRYVGGNLMYIDCVPELQSYYATKLGFSYYDRLDEHQLIRMIRGI